MFLNSISQKLFIAIFLLLTSLPVQAASPYEALRSQFRWGKAPNIEDLYTGHDWYCSGDRYAARGLFRYVREWSLFYNFTYNQGQIENLVREDIINSAMDQEGLRLELEPGWWEVLRVNNEGHLIIEVATTSDWPQQFGQKTPMDPSLSVDGTRAQMYFICESPTSHNQDNWDADYYNIWTLTPLPKP